MFPPTDNMWRQGFTLIDLMVSMILLTVVMTMVYGAFGQISTHAVALSEDLTARQELRLLMRLVADDLASAQWLDRVHEMGVGHQTGIVSETEFLDGKDFTRIRFHAAGPSRFHRGLPAGYDPGLHEVAYRVRRDDKNKLLNLERREDFYLDDDMTAGGVEVVIAEDIEEFLVEFLPVGADLNAAEEPWEKRWDSNESATAKRLPAAIRLTLARKGKAGKLSRHQVSFNLGFQVKP